MKTVNVRRLIWINVMTLTLEVLAFWAHGELQPVARGAIPFIPSLVWLLSTVVIASTLLFIVVGHGAIGVKIGKRLFRRRSEISTARGGLRRLVAIASFVASAYVSLSYDSAVYDNAGWSAWVSNPIIVVGFEVGLWLVATRMWNRTRRITSKGYDAR
jgi:hypothetical protein